MRYSTRSEKINDIDFKSANKEIKIMITIMIMIILLPKSKKVSNRELEITFISTNGEKNGKNVSLHI